MLERLWNDIELIYDGFNFSSLHHLVSKTDGVPESIREKYNINGLMIMSKDNYYSIYYKSNDSITYIRIEKDYNLINMWGLGKFTEGEFKTIDYKIHLWNEMQIDGKILHSLNVDDTQKIELVYKIIKPFLREVKLKEIGI